MKKNKKDNKIEIIILGAVFIYCIVVGGYFLYLKSQVEETTLKTYIILNSEDFYTYEDNNIQRISFLDTDFSDHLFKIYSNYNYKGEYYVSNLSLSYNYVNFLTKTKSGNYVPDNPYIAITEDIEYIEYEKEELDSVDLSNFEKIMNDKNIYDTDNLASSYKVVFDFDNDSKDETLVVVSNYDYITIRENMFSIVYIEDDDEFQILEEYYFTEDEYMEYIKCDFSYLLKLDESKYTFIISSSDDDSTINNFYEKDGKSYISI